MPADRQVELSVHVSDLDEFARDGAAVDEPEHVERRVGPLGLQLGGRLAALAA